MVRYLPDGEIEKVPVDFSPKSPVHVYDRQGRRFFGPDFQGFESDTVNAKNPAELGAVSAHGTADPQGLGPDSGRAGDADGARDFQDFGRSRPPPSVRPKNWENKKYSASDPPS